MYRPTVLVKQGWLRGAEVKSEVGGAFISFKGVPFAEPPVGELRFKDPQPKQAWTGVREALEDGPQCPQIDMFSQKIEGDEDCLYLNVATTSLKGSRPVMVWFHGGGFIWGDAGSRLYGPDYLVKHNVIVVKIHYRLGIFGFLQLEDEAAAGNMGLKDQAAGLKWVKENITQFGGDSNNVTIFGESAGGVSVHYHLLSPFSKGLFHKAIVQSGVAINPWACTPSPVNLVRRLVAHLGKETTDSKEIVEFLRTIAAHKLAGALQNLTSIPGKTAITLPFGPSIDSKSAEPFIPRHPCELIYEAQDVPVMFGYNSVEGIILIQTIESGGESRMEQVFEQLVSRMLSEFPTSKMSHAKAEIKEYYFGEKDISKDVIDSYIQFLGDTCFVLGIHEAALIQAKAKSPSYFYRFSHDSPQKLSKHFLHLEIDIKGAGHMDELAYIFRPEAFPDVPFIEPGSVEQIISERFLRLWTDFAKTGNPTPKIDDLIRENWQPMSTTTKNYLNIDAELTPSVDPDQEMWKFWKSIRTTGTTRKLQ
ncbi:juvenile hormone esterase-like [Diprion similis]|uniref:juvenile hormone esterase-like n=1 Tax=Diprion similis TaxID=362088 RepID=UPI001EF7F3E1|nr:juvenile hormone esterase-like [Diprion similis]XP_046751125.1 juvenile hormone esterase-like [Diprion similis]